MALNQLQLSLQFARTPEVAAHRAELARHRVQRWVRHALSVDAEITVRVVDEEEGRQLNRDFRHKDYATNVPARAHGAGRSGAVRPGGRARGA